jgi:hypothetical protein
MPETDISPPNRSSGSRWFRWRLAALPSLVDRHRDDLYRLCPATVAKTIAPLLTSEVAPAGRRPGCFRKPDIKTLSRAMRDGGIIKFLPRHAEFSKPLTRSCRGVLFADVEPEKPDPASRLYTILKHWHSSDDPLQPAFADSLFPTLEAGKVKIAKRISLFEDRFADHVAQLRAARMCARGAGRSYQELRGLKSIDSGIRVVRGRPLHSTASAGGRRASKRRARAGYLARNSDLLRGEHCQESGGLGGDGA